MLTNLGNKKIPKEVIEEKFLIEMHEAYRNLREKFLKLRDEGKITQQLLVTRLGWDKSLVSKRLHGRENLTFKTLSALATAMECKLDLRWIEYSELTKHNSRFDDLRADERSSFSTGARFIHDETVEGVASGTRSSFTIPKEEAA